MALARPLISACAYRYEAHGIEIVANETYAYGTTDFYPYLTKVLANNPQLIDLDTAPPGDARLLIKQLHELGWEGPILLKSSLAGVSGEIPWEWMQGLMCMQADYERPLFPERSRELAREFSARYPEYGGYVDMGWTYLYAQAEMLEAAIEWAGSIDTDAVADAFDDPDFTFDFWGFESEMTGLETWGYRCKANAYIPFSVVEGEKVVTKVIVRVPTP